jgi:small-conductance mechanosensitive channel
MRITIMSKHNSHDRSLKTQTTYTSIKNVAIALAIVVGLFLALFVFRVPPANLLTGGVLFACLFVHVWMMRGMNHK